MVTTNIELDQRGVKEANNNPLYQQVHVHNSDVSSAETNTVKSNSIFVARRYVVTSRCREY